MPKEPILHRRTFGSTQVLSVRVNEVREADTIAALGVQIRREIEASGAGCRYVLDLSDVTYQTSAALGMVINVRAHLADRGYPFALAGAAGDVARVLAHAHLGEVIPLYPSVEEAVEQMRCC